MSSRNCDAKRPTLLRALLKLPDLLENIGYSVVIPTRTPSAHIRQLIYLALWPLAALSSSGKLKGLDNGKEKEVDPFSIVIKSPSKTKRSNKDRRPEDEFVPPSSEAIERSWRLLHAYSLTYPPELLLRAIPCYPLRDSEVASVPREIDAGVPWQISTGEDMDSILSKVAVILKEQKDCWGLLRPGVVAPPKDDSSPAQKRQPVPPLSSDEEDESSVPALIGTHSWPLLEWLITLFEKDQELADVTRSGTGLANIARKLEMLTSILQIASQCFFYRRSSLQAQIMSSAQTSIQSSMSSSFAMNKVMNDTKI